MIGSDERFIIDASVAIKWFFWEDGSEESLKLLDSLISFYVPEFFLMEIDSVITKKVRRGELKAGEAINKRKQFRRLPYKLISYKEIEDFAFEISTKFPVTLYDACYLSTAIDYEATVYTADIRFFNGVKSSPFNDYIERITY